MSAKNVFRKSDLQSEQRIGRVENWVCEKSSVKRTIVFVCHETGI